MRMVAAGEVGKYKATAWGGDSSIFVKDAPCVCWLQGQEAWCIVVAYLLSLFKRTPKINLF